MKADITWLDNPEIFRVHKLPAHSDHTFYKSGEERKSGKNTLLQSLNGIWKFHYSVNNSERPENFYEESYDANRFDEISVPCHIELAGYDKIHYINTAYPWEGHVFRRPAYLSDENNGEAGTFSQADYHPVGSYIRRFDLEDGLKGQRVCLCMAGVEQAAYVWLNGQFVGYTEDSFIPAEFDLTPYIREKDNILAIEVHKQSTAAFLEDQDFFRFFGIFREVYLYAKPRIHVEDMWAQTAYTPETGEGSLHLRMQVSGENAGGKVRITLKNADGISCFSKEEALSEQLDFGWTELGKVIPWEHKNPYLYTFEIELTDSQGKMTELVPYQLGFCRIEIRDKVMYLNGKRLIINGVNRHEWSAEGGRCITQADMEWDMACIRRNHINAVRTCHYPNQLSWYSLCDENGIYMMAENNLESHGSWQKMGKVEPSWNVPGSSQKWEAAVVDRARSNFEWFKNHVSILFWSLGNESYVGDCIREMNRFYKEKDEGRLTHYEGVFQNRRYEDTVSDVESRMYATPAEVREYLDNQPKKPFLMCEYMHDMGNSLGGMDSYMKLLKEYKLYQGGFIWDFIDQAILTEDEVTGEKVLRYGGDFDDRPSDYEFAGNGIVFADRTEKPAMQEVSYYYDLYRE